LSAGAMTQTSHAQTYSFDGVGSYTDTIVSLYEDGPNYQVSGGGGATLTIYISLVSPTQGFVDLTLLGYEFLGEATFDSAVTDDAASGSLLSQGPRSNDEVYFGFSGNQAEANVIGVSQTSLGDEIEYLNIEFQTLPLAVVPEPSSALIAVSGILAVSFFLWARRRVGRFIGTNADATQSRVGQ
jgi:hypothetical protein